MRAGNGLYVTLIQAAVRSTEAVSCSTNWSASAKRRAIASVGVGAVVSAGVLFSVISEPTLASKRIHYVTRLVAGLNTLRSIEVKAGYSNLGNLSITLFIGDFFVREDITGVLLKSLRIATRKSTRWQAEFVRDGCDIRVIGYRIDWYDHSGRSVNSSPAKLAARACYQRA